MILRCRTRPSSTRLFRSFHSSPLRRRELFDPNNVERASDDVDVCIVGGGPAGLRAAIRLKQLEQENEILRRATAYVARDVLPK